jgi:hypothetical protein
MVLRWRNDRLVEGVGVEERQRQHAHEVLNQGRFLGDRPPVRSFESNRLGGPLDVPRRHRLVFRVRRLRRLSPRRALLVLIEPGEWAHLRLIGRWCDCRTDREAAGPRFSARQRAMHVSRPEF